MRRRGVAAAAKAAALVRVVATCRLAAASVAAAGALATRPVGRRGGAAAAALALLLLAVPSARADEAAAFLALSDVHLDPFTGTATADARLVAEDVAAWPAILASAPVPPVPSYGRDANVPLLDAVLADAARRVPAPDFVVYGGDAVVHRLAERVRAAAPGADEAVVAAAAVKTTAFLAARLRATYPDVPVLLALGNTDSDCGDYGIEPGGPYLAGTFGTLRDLVGADRLEADAAATWRAGGWYAARHPTLPRTVVVVLNTVLWSPKYANRCGAPDAPPPGEAMLAWLEARLRAADAAGERVWLVHHVPTGVDAYATAHAPATAACTARTVPLWRDPFPDAFVALLARHPGVVQTAFSGHVHRDSWRLFPGEPLSFESIVPAVSPVYGDAPAYQRFGYDRTSGLLREKTTFAVTNLEKAAAGAPVALAELYAFGPAYGAGPYGAEALRALTAALATDAPSAARTLYGRFYGAGHGDDPATDWPVYGCAPGAPTAAAFDACRCGG